LYKNSPSFFYSSFALAVIFVANLFLFIPFDIYVANNEEFVAPFNAYHANHCRSGACCIGFSYYINRAAISARNHKVTEDEKLILSCTVRLSNKPPTQGISTI
jgi:hypothetical protein